MVLSDTVGFIRDLPHGLVAAFRATLEETVHADLLLHVVDALAGARGADRRTVDKVLAEIGAGGSRRSWSGTRSTGYLAGGSSPGVERDEYGRISRVFVSARTGAGLDGLRGAIAEARASPRGRRGAAASAGSYSLTIQCNVA